MDNDNNKAVNVWALTAPKTQEWEIGRVEVSSEGDKTYQVISCIHKINKKLFYYLLLSLIKNKTYAISLNALQFEFIVERASNAKGYVAIDDVEFRAIELCEFNPPDAKPVETTTHPTTTTIEPTEPPDCKNRDCCTIYILI